MTFGQVIAEARKKLPLSQKELANRIRKEDGEPISPQYLNDIERDRRIPSAHVVEELARVLREDKDYLYHLAGTLPADLKKARDRKKVVSAYKTFRRNLAR